MTKTDTILDLIAGQIREGTLPPGRKLIPVRRAAEHFGVSKNTVVGVYDRLCAQGLIEARPGSGFYVSDQRSMGAMTPAPPPPSITQAVDRISLLGAQLGGDFSLRVGDGRPPTSWSQGVIPARLGPKVLAELGGDQTGYGNVHGSAALRDQIVLSHRLKGIQIHAGNVLTTFGANHALDLVIRRLLAEGQTVLVDDPGYYPLFAKLSLQGLKVVGVPRTATGPDLAALAQLAVSHSPRMFFTQSLCQNPTGTSIDLPTAHGILQLAKQYGFAIVDNDPFIDLPGTNGTRLGQLDQFRSVIQIGSYSKLMSASIRVGYIIAPTEVCERIAELKLVTIVNSSGLAETLVADLLANRRYQRHVRKIETRLALARADYLARIRKLGLQTLGGDGEGYYSYLLLPPATDEAGFVRSGAAHGIFFAPGSVFRVNDKEPGPPALRINITRSEDPRFYGFLQKALKGQV
ncbi:PLP-dependent aminotransferase family protein [Frigidibacter sp.]|uniref:aminotransferase-like domain-containing protein n=1 Tax=Frigidibacter sp. TaxID=2586418 RepID=UPI0027375FB1|nr:PLP-dependent aminotransferase family protein [Frigidibacter sp.]MDP3339296.1 PLP-dependent aminotransferase family protein [Frigidibacter sp.]